MHLLLSLSLLIFVTLATRAAEPFEIKDGDRVLFLGDTLLEREGTYGYLETRMHEQFRDRHFIVRNLAFSADTPLGWSRASFDPAAKGFDRLKEQLELVKPTVVFLGYGMAASLQEMTDRSGDSTLNPDPARYGAEPMSAARFKGELGQLMDAINALDSATKVRFVLLSPIRHEDLRATRPGLPDPARHNELLAQYSKAIEELAKERGARFLDFSYLPPKNLSVTDNGIHLSDQGYLTASVIFARELAIEDRIDRAIFPELTPEKRESLRAAIIRKNELFFHRWRPANSTYLFGFRKHEQGQNAKEIPEFDPLIEQAEAEIDRLKRAGANAAQEGERPREPKLSNDAATLNATARGDARPPGGTPPAPPLPHPDFTVAEGFQIELWAENPLLYKPTQMNWDPQGRLWVASSALYPQIAPGGTATDTILVLEDTDHDGKADKSSVFAEGLLIPTGVQPSYLPGKDGATHYGCYVGQSTELLFFEDTDGDGRADKKRIVLSGFGTEDTHHIIHTLKRGPDRRLYFNQSVYIHSHMETPWGVVRLNSGGVLAWDPFTEKVEVFSKGLWNTWGHQFDKWGQSFQTDGAGSTGITWSFQGATFAPFEGARRTTQSISPGSYPKFAGLELISSPHFPADWQGNAITCDFRAHRVVRFGLTDLSQGEKPQAGYTTQEMPDVVRTSDVSFRPIDVKLGPDGALYVADWSNPVINHGEVDFRDPRRDHTHGRIWRITRKAAPLVKWEPLQDKKNPELLDRLLSENLWDKEQARAVLGKRLVVEMERKKTAARAAGAVVLTDDSSDVLPEVDRWFQQNRSEDKLREIVLLESNFTSSGWARYSALLESKDARARALVPRLMAGLISRGATRPGPGAAPPPSPASTAGEPKRIRNLYSLPKVATDPNPHVRLEALRTLARMPSVRSTELILDAALQADGDPFLEYAAWLSINDLAKRWTDYIARGDCKIEGREAQLEYGLNAIDPALAGATLAKLLDSGKIALTKGPWIELIGRAGGPEQLSQLLDSLALSYAEDCCPNRDLTKSKATSLSEADAVRAVAALVEAARVRNIKPDGELALAHLAPNAPEPLRPGLARLAGYWKSKDAFDFLPAMIEAKESKPALRLAAIEGLRALGGKNALNFLEVLTRPDQPLDIRRAALVAIAQINLDAGIIRAADVLPAITDENVALATWRELLAVQRAADAFAVKFRDPQWAKALPKPVLVAGVRAAREAGRKGQALAQALDSIAGVPAAPAAPADYKALAEKTKQNGDPAQGEFIYRRATSGCTTCHAIGGAGGIVGPALTSMGASAPLDYIIESLLAPNAKVKEGYNAVTLKLKDGTEVTGIQARETAQEVVLRNVAGQETPVAKANITGKTDVGSIMPAGLLEALSDRERLNLYAFLGELGKPGPYDASKNAVARVWRLYPGGQPEKALKQDTSDFPALAYTFVDGRLLKDQLNDALQLVPNPGDTVFATAQFQVAAAGRTRLNLTGISKAWLDGKPLAVASEPNPAPDLAPGVHTLAVKLDVKSLPETLRVAAAGTTFLGN